MSTEAERAAAHLAGRRKAQVAVDLLVSVLKEAGLEAGGEQWPGLQARASLAGEPAVYLGTVPLATAERLADVLIAGGLAERRRAQRALEGAE
ncbi:hypothetical protein [Streptomyces sp. ODS28]|uniref:hypothetical protein n=1 Tax=Streptomyces sp. ODS28 TaxID=3136688 RepID=UPI0031E6B728